jgi:sterol desaturase/sphingolipid hydroxylase (fatty acid hydroxylase superfamily)
MSPSIQFHLSMSTYIMIGIAVFGPVLMTVLDAAVARGVARGWIQRSSTGPVDGVGLYDLKFMASFVLVTGVMALAIQYLLFQGRSFPIDLGVRPLEMVGFATLLMLAVDTNGFFWHRFSHRNAAAFRAFHDGHHESRGNIHAAVAFNSNTVWDYPLHSGITISLGVSLLVLLSGRYPVVTLVYGVTVYVLGLAAMHSGVRETPVVRAVLWLILLPIKLVPSAIRLEDHQRHHAEGNCNYGVFFSHWDRLLGSWDPAAREPARPDPAHCEPARS